MPSVPNYSPPQFSAIDATPTRVSTTSTGQQTIYGSYGIIFSPDGTFAAFFGDAVNLVDGDTNNCRDVFVKSLVTGAVTRISTAADGVQGNQDSVAPVFLPGGGKIAFMSWANNLVAGDTNGLPDIFIKDLANGAITRASTFSDGSQFTVSESYSTTGISAPEFSPDGTKMAFTFQVAGATVYIKDLITGTLTVAVPTSFAEGPNMPGARFSPDGTKLLYRQYDSTGNFSLFIKDLASGNVTLVSTNAAGDPANRPSQDARFSPDGTHIVFTSGADNLVPGQNGGLFIKDLLTGAVSLVAVYGYAATFSPDGTKVAFTSASPTDSNPFTDIYVKDLLTGVIARVSVDTRGNEASHPNELPVWSPDGLSVGFYGDELVQPDTNGSNEVYMARLNLPAAYVEGGPAVQIVPVAKALDLGSPDYDTGSLSVAITAGSVAGDLLSLALSSAPGESIAISGNQAFVNNILIGTFASTATSLAFSFNANATNAVVELLTEAVRISSASEDPTAAVRTVTFTLVDGGGTADGALDTASFSRKVAFVPVDNGQQIIGTPGADSLAGGAGNDVIDGRAAADTMAGHAGNDTYYVDAAGDVVVEAADEGRDVVYSTVDYALGASQSIEVLSARTHAGTDPLSLTGNSFGQEIWGNAGANNLRGGGGTDYLIGQGGNDTYFVDTASALVFENAGGGRDVVYSSVNYVLLAGQEIEVLSASNHAGTDPLSLTGNELGQEIWGNAGANNLRGGGGTDYLIGQGGNDNYFVDTASALVFESAGGGRDVVYASVNYVLNAGQEIEVLSASDHAATVPLSLTGNELAQEIWGNAGANSLRGGGGADLLIGQGGNDTYFVDVAGVQVYEGANGGRDVIYASVDYVLAAGQEVEVLSASNHSATTPLNLTGNELAQEIWGNSGANNLRGGGGNDALLGQGGNDTYFVDVAGVQVYENAGAGRDVVYASVNYALTAGQEVEVLSTSNHAATTALNMTGNELVQELWGNAGANILDGKGGNDALIGQGGADTFTFTTALGANNVDFVADFVAGTDRIALDDAVFTGLTPGALPASAFVLGTSAQDADDRIIYNSATGQLYFDADGNGAGAAIQFATLSGHPVIAASDFTVI